MLAELAAQVRSGSIDPVESVINSVRCSGSLERTMEVSGALVVASALGLSFAA